MQINYDKTNGFYIGKHELKDACKYTNIDDFLYGCLDDDTATITLIKRVDIEKFYKWIDRNKLTINKEMSRYE